MKKILFILPVLAVFVVVSGCRHAEIEKKKQYIERGRIFTVIPPSPYWSSYAPGDGLNELEDDEDASAPARRAKIHGDEAFTGRIILERRKFKGDDEEYIKLTTRDINIEEAATYYIQAYDLGWKDYLLCFRIGWCLQRTAPEKAAKYFHISNEMYKTEHKGKLFYDAMFSEASCYMLTGKYLDKKEYAEKFTEVNYKLFKDDDNKGATMADKTVVKKGAISLFSELLEKQPEYRLAYYNRAISYYTVGYYQEAYDDISKFLDMSKKSDVYTTCGKELSLLCKKELRIPIG